MRKRKNDEVIRIYEWPKEGVFTFLPFWLPAGASGKITLTHEVAKAGSKLPVVSWRNAIFMGLHRANLVLDTDVIIHRMKEEDEGCWMSTIPQEIEQHNRQLKRAHGSVLVGGLGIGLAVGILHQNRKVTKITVLETNPDIARLVEPWLPSGKAKVIHDDLYSWLKCVKKAGISYDFAYYDIWCPTGQYMFTKHILPLRRLSLGVVPQNQIELWNELEVLGQIEHGLMPWIGGREYWANMLKARKDMSGTKNPFDMTKEQFAEFGSFNREVWPFAAWCHANQPTQERARLQARRYMNALRDAELYDEVWKEWENYGKTNGQAVSTGSGKGDSRPTS